LFSAATPTRPVVQPASVPSPVVKDTHHDATPIQRATESSAKVQKTPANGIEKALEEKAKITDENGKLAFYFWVYLFF
jgi:hypothetical protein